MQVRRVWQAVANMGRFAPIWLAAGLMLGWVSPSMAELERISGDWSNESGYNITIKPDALGGWTIWLGNGGQGSIQNDGTYGGNIRVEAESRRCHYRATIIANGYRMRWQLLAGPPECLKGEFNRIGEIPGEVKDNDIKPKELRHDYIAPDAMMHYTAFIYEMPVYAYVDVGSSDRVSILYAACGNDHCDQQRSQRMFCALQGLKPATLTPDMLAGFENEDFSKHWLWDLDEGKTVRMPVDGVGLTYFTKVPCRK